MKTAQWSRWTLFMASLGWLLLTATSYLWIPLFRVSWLLAGLALSVSWLWAVLWSFAAVMSHLSLKAYIRAFVILVSAVTLGAAVWATDWKTVYVDSQFWLHRDEFAALAAAHDNHEPLVVPWWMKYLSKDGQAWDQGDVLYLPVFEDWRAETGAGIAYLPGPPDSRMIIQTAAGDLGIPVRALGDGWWWVE
ncbi:MULTISPECIES: hypothetical protein [Streptosporangium]|uniref:Uncharacterized protein n=1 Tax=Streptosporangium brasiliense TaxID=47480 RepID=A0ABT9R2A9_9ACTN|nr:hypothetical protein [Streptosporangium brasiliense]MDP9863368.1 hypothetical protein [Streptosporangium brasiliense]